RPLLHASRHRDGRGGVPLKKMMFIKTCSCHHNCPRENDIFLASNSRRMIGDYDND
ncbi:hypothetical protein M9458_037627, partial [Cirrhinus mrigala]